MKFAVTFGRLNPAFWLDVAMLADDLGFESIWLPEHLVFPLEMRGQLNPGEEHPPVPASTPVYDAGAYLSFIAAKTSRIRLGTFVYLLGIRHPFVGARAFATLDVVSGGRAEVGVGAGWLVNEWEAVGLDPRTRDFVRINGRPYQRRPLDEEWILARWPADLRAARRAA